MKQLLQAFVGSHIGPNLSIASCTSVSGIALCHILHPVIKAFVEEISVIRFRFQLFPRPVVSRNLLEF